MIRASIGGMEDTSELVTAFKKINSINKSILRIVKIKNKLHTPLKHVALNFIYGNEIIGEL